MIRFFTISILLLLIAAGAATVVGLAASNTIEVSGLDDITVSINPNDLKPAGCAEAILNNIVVDGNGTGADDLLVGDATITNLDGRHGSDCLYPSLAANAHCKGGPGKDYYVNCATESP